MGESRKIYVVIHDPVCDCGHTTIVMITQHESLAKQFVESKGKYSDYEYTDYNLDEDVRN